MPVDEAALHAAIIAVNEALDHDAEDNAARALRNPAACLADINQVRAPSLVYTRNMSYMGHRGFSTRHVPYFSAIFDYWVPKLSLISPIFTNSFFTFAGKQP